MVHSLRTRSRTNARREPSVESHEDGTVTVAVDALVIGSTNQFPIHDHRNVLLLSSGHVVTDRVKSRLRGRNVRRVRLHADDAARMTRPVVPRTKPSEPRAGSGRRIRIDQGERHFSNTGPALSDRLVEHGVSRPNERHTARVRERLSIVVDGLTDMIDDSNHPGGRVNESGVVNAASLLLEDLLADRDAMLTIDVDAEERTQLARHCVAMSTLGMAIATELGLNADNVQRVGVAGLIHDWGMTRVPAAIRNKRGRLTVSEMLEVKKHPSYALDIASRAPGLPPMVSLVVHQVHERMDGRGYPRGRRGDGIHLFARILHVADQYVALRSPRPFRDAVSPYASVRTLLEHRAGSAVDPNVLRALLHVVSLFPVGSYVELSDGSTVRVLRAGTVSYDSPIVEIVRDTKGREFDEGPLIDLATSELKVVRALPTPGCRELHHAAHDHGLELRPHVAGR